MRNLRHFFEKNKKWAENKKRENPDFFKHLSQQQSPEYLWIGCSDSRVPATEIVNMDPGEIFVHRNIGNQVIHTDFNCLSVIQYAVEVLQVKHIIVCGHYDCGAIKAAMDKREHGLIDNWLRHIKDLHHLYEDKLEKISDEHEKQNLLCEVNIIEQVANICHTTIVQNSWKAGRDLTVHGWIYSVEDGILRDLDVSIKNNKEIPLIHRLH